jgi:hypothetical protein
MVGHVGMYGGGQPSVESPVLMLRNGVGWYSLGRWGNRRPGVSYRALAQIRQFMTIRHVRTRGPTGRRCARSGRPECCEEPGVPPIAPVAGHVVNPSQSAFRATASDTVIVTVSASFINSRIGRIYEGAVACDSDSAITSDTLIPLFAST